MKFFEAAIFCLLLILAQPLFAAGDLLEVPIYTVTNVIGDVIYQIPLGGEWKKINKKMTIPENSLLQINSNSTVTFEAKGSLGKVGVKFQATSVVINEPMTIRIGAKIFRRIEMDSKVISSLPDLESVKLLKKRKLEFDSFLDAWRQDAASLSGDEWVNDDIMNQLSESAKGALKKDPVSVTGRRGKIIVHNPKKNQIILAMDSRTTFNLDWSTLPSDGPSPAEYNIYIWKAGQKRLVFARVKSDRFTANINQLGKHYLQIESIDGSFQSELQSFYVEGPVKAPDKMEAEATQAPGETTLAEEMRKRVKLVTPIPELYWSSVTGWPIFGFTWKGPVIGPRDCLFRFMVKDEMHKIRFKADTGNEFIQWQPPSDFIGRFEWSVQSLSCRDKNNKLVKSGTISNARRIFLEKTTSFDTVFTNFAKKNSRGVLVLDW